MAVVTVAFNGTNVSQAETNSDGGNWNKWGTTQNPSQESDFVYQNTYCMSNKVSSTTNGVELTATTSVDFSTTPKAMLALVQVTTTGLIDTTVVGGCVYQLGQSDTVAYDYYIFGSETLYPIKGGWVILAIDPNEIGYRDATQGSPSLTVLDYYAWYAVITASSKSENVMHDTLNYVDTGTPWLTLTGGDGASADGIFDDFVAKDEGTVANRYGVVSTIEDIIFVSGMIQIGSATHTDFTDANRVLVWPDSRTASGYNALKIDLGNSGSVVDIQDCIFQGNGRGFGYRTFDTITDVDATNDVITTPGQGEFVDFDYVIYNDAGGSDTIGLTDGNGYFIAWDVANSGWAFYLTRANARADTSRQTLNDGATGEDHYIVKDTDTRPDLKIINTTGSAVIDGCSFLNFRYIETQSVVAFTNCVVIGAQITALGADLSGTSMSGYEGDPDLAALLWDGNNDPDGKLDGMSFEKGTEATHAIWFGATSPLTLDLNDIAFSGYNASDGQDDSTIHVARGSGTVTINATNCTGNISIKTAGATVVLVRDPVTTTITVKDGDTDAVIQNARVLLIAADASGDLPYQAPPSQITRSGAVATVDFTAHGLVTGDFAYVRGCEEREYNVCAAITKVNDDQFTYAVNGTPASPANGGPTITGGYFNTLTDVNGQVEDEREITLDQPMIGWARKSSSSPYYRTATITGTVGQTTGLELTILLQSDE